MVKALAVLIILPLAIIATSFLLYFLTKSSSKKDK
jgi:hypothetical protein